MQIPHTSESETPWLEWTLGGGWDKLQVPGAGGAPNRCLTLEDRAGDHIEWEGVIPPTPLLPSPPAVRMPVQQRAGHLGC